MVNVIVNSIEEKLKEIGIELFDYEIVEKGDDSAIDNLIDAIDNNNEDDDIGF